MSDVVWQFEHAVECSASRSVAWSFWTDVANWERLEGEAVEWIRIEGPFEEGTHGATKSPGQDPYKWVIVELRHDEFAKIDLPLDGATFHNEMVMELLEADRTKITQRLSLSGPKAGALVEGMKMFETSAPQGLAKLAKAIEEAA